MEFYKRDDTNQLLGEDWANNSKVISSPIKTLSVSPTRRVTFITDMNELFRADSGLGTIPQREETLGDDKFQRRNTNTSPSQDYV